MGMLLNDGSELAPRLAAYLNLDTVMDLRPDSSWFKRCSTDFVERIKDDGFDGIQLTQKSSVDLGSKISLPYCGLGRVNTPAAADSLISRHADRGDVCITVHAGWGMEDDDEMHCLVDAILEAALRHALPVFIETHRATITQDIWRTVQLTKQFPDVLFNTDFSHWYCGQELRYGDWDVKMKFLEPVFARTGFMHGRIASSGCMQVPIETELSRRPIQAHGKANYLAHFRELWTRSMRGFLKRAGPGSILIFAPELLSGEAYYARLYPNGDGDLVEETDRYEQALLLRALAVECFAAAGQMEMSGA
jgi:hypothetical protein